MSNYQNSNHLHKLLALGGDNYSSRRISGKSDLRTNDSEQMIEESLSKVSLYANRFVYHTRSGNPTEQRHNSERNVTKHPTVV